MAQPQIRNITDQVRVSTKIIGFGVRRVARLQVFDDGQWNTVSKKFFPVGIRADAYEAMKHKAKTLGIIQGTE